MFAEARYQGVEGGQLLFRKDQFDQFQFSELECLRIIRCFHRAVALKLDRFLHGGTYPVDVLNDEDRRMLPRIFQLNPLPARMPPAASMPFIRIGFSGLSTAVLRDDNQIYVACGRPTASAP